jgi:hypothetical protein
MIDHSGRPEHGGVCDRNSGLCKSVSTCASSATATKQLTELGDEAQLPREETQKAAYRVKGQCGTWFAWGWGGSTAARTGVVGVQWAPMV